MADIVLTYTIPKISTGIQRVRRKSEIFRQVEPVLQQQQLQQPKKPVVVVAQNNYSEQFHFGKLSFPLPANSSIDKNAIPAKRVSSDEFRTLVSSGVDGLSDNPLHGQYEALYPKMSERKGMAQPLNTLPEPMNRALMQNQRPTPPPQRVVKESLMMQPDATRPNKSQPPRPGWERPMMPNTIKGKDHVKTQARPNASAPMCNGPCEVDPDDDILHETPLRVSGGVVQNQEKAFKQANVAYFQQRAPEARENSGNRQDRRVLSENESFLTKKDSGAVPKGTDQAFGPFYQLKGGARGEGDEFTQGGGNDASGFMAGSRFQPKPQTSGGSDFDPWSARMRERQQNDSENSRMQGQGGQMPQQKHPLYFDAEDDNVRTRVGAEGQNYQNKQHSLAANDFEQQQQQQNYRAIGNSVPSSGAKISVDEDDHVARRPTAIFNDQTILKRERLGNDEDQNRLVDFHGERRGPEEMGRTRVLARDEDDIENSRIDGRYQIADNTKSEMWRETPTHSLNTRPNAAPVNQQQQFVERNVHQETNEGSILAKRNREMGVDHGYSGQAMPNPGIIGNTTDNRASANYNRGGHVVNQPLTSNEGSRIGTNHGSTRNAVEMVSSWDENSRSANRMETAFDVYGNQHGSVMPSRDEENHRRIGNDRDFADEPKTSSSDGMRGFFDSMIAKNNIRSQVVPMPKKESFYEQMMKVQ